MLSMLLILNAALAQDVDNVDFKGTDKAIEPADAPVAALSSEVGGAMASGNTDFWTIKGTLNGSYRWDANKFTLGAMGLTGRSRLDADGSGILDDNERTIDRVINAKKFDSEVRYDRFLGEKASLYVLSGALVDQFAGYNLRSHEQFGYSRNLLSGDNTTLITELGFDVAQEFRILPEGSTDPDYANIFAARVLVGFNHTFKESIKLSETVEAYENVFSVADLRVINHAAITMQMSENLALKLSNDLLFDNTPVDGFQPTDQTTMLSVVATIL